MQQNCDDHGDFTRCDDGTVEFNHFVQLRSIVIRQANRAFNDRRLELNEKFLLAYKRQWPYEQKRQVYEEGKIDYEAAMEKMIDETCTKIGLVHSVY